MIPSRVPSRREHGDARRRPCPPSLKSLALAGRIAAATLTALFLIPAAASAQDSAAAADPPPDQPASATAATDNLSRWVDLQTANVLGRFRYVENSAHVVTARQLQDSLSLRARLKLDRGARLSVTGAAATGTSFTGSWNNTGIGTGDPVHALSVKQLYLGAVPWARGGGVVRRAGADPRRVDRDHQLRQRRLHGGRAGQPSPPEGLVLRRDIGDRRVSGRCGNAECVSPARSAGRDQLRSDSREQEGDVVADRVRRRDARFERLHRPRRGHCRSGRQQSFSTRSATSNMRAPERTPPSDMRSPPRRRSAAASRRDSGTRTSIRTTAG